MEKFKDRLLTVPQVRERLNCSRRQVYSLINLGEIAALKIGAINGIRVKESKLEAFLDKREKEECLF
jgi:excisionase family DNA binding protein